MALSQLGLLRPALCRCLVPLLRSSCQLAVSSRVPPLLPNTSKAAKGQAAKVNINSSLAEDIISLEEGNEEMAAVLTCVCVAPACLTTLVCMCVHTHVLSIRLYRVTREHMENRVKQFTNKSKESLRRVRPLLSLLFSTLSGRAKWQTAFAADVDKHLATKTKGDITKMTTPLFLIQSCLQWFLLQI
uniref:Uncharacterized protein n=1 Tax=Salmo trutta TaxID=8032 RepID=A0A673Y4M5_SALTR